MLNELRRIEKAKLIPVAIIDNLENTLVLAETVIDSGLDLLEITLRTNTAIESIKMLNDELPEITVGAGTVFSVNDAIRAVSFGAKFIVSPHFDGEILEYCLNNNILYCPGALTPNEIQSIIKTASRLSPNNEGPQFVIKIFPASFGGPNYISALNSVFPNAKFIPTGGINETNLSQYIKAGSFAIGGTWICKREDINSGNMKKISSLIKNAIKIISDTSNT